MCVCESVCVLTGEDCEVGVFVAVVRGTAHRVNACVMFDGRGTDERSVSWDQFVFVYALALLGGQSGACLANGDETDAICRAAGVGNTAITVTLEGWREKGGKG